MVELGSASGRVEDTTRVHLEDGLVSLNGDGSWLFGNGGLELVDGSGRNVGVSGDINLSVSLVNMAGAGSWGNVWVSRLELLLVGLKVGESVSLPSTVATVRGSVAVNNLLLGEGEKVAGLDGMSSLNGASGRESPA